MDWENERYVRVYTRDTGDILAIGWEGRTVLWELMRKVDRAGVLDENDDDIVAELLRLPHEITGIGLARLAKRLVIERRNNLIVIPNFIDAQEAKQSDKQRQAESRARRREMARAGDLSRIVTGTIQLDDHVVTNRDSSVTVSHSQSQSVTPSLAEPTLAEPTLAENIDVSETKASDQSMPRKRKPKTTFGDDHQATRAADYLRTAILVQIPTLPLAKGFKQRQDWAAEIDRLHRINGHSYTEIKEIIDWAVPHLLVDNSWRVRSASSLRKKFHNLKIAKVISETATKKVVSTSRPSTPKQPERPKGETPWQYAERIARKRAEQK